MEKRKANRLTREDWLSAAMEMSLKGIEKVKVAPLATKLGVTTGSFYWHFKNRRELLDCLLEYWEYEKTDVAMIRTRQVEAPPLERISFLLREITSRNLPGYDLPIWIWAQSDAKAEAVFTRVVRKRVAFVSSLFREAGFSKDQAEVRARMMVVYLMGEATLLPISLAKREEFLNLKHSLLTTPANTMPRP